MKILVVGAGGHAAVVSDIVQILGHEIIGFLDDDPSIIGKKILNTAVLNTTDAYDEYAFDKLLLATGDNKSRYELHSLRFAKLSADDWFTAIHPSAILSTSVHLGSGTVVMAGAVINANATIGTHVILNTGCTVDHDAVVDDYAHIAPGVNLAGGVQIGQGVLMGIGSCVTPYRKIGSWSVVGAGATVVSDIEESQTVIGTPARPMKR